MLTKLILWQLTLQIERYVNTVTVDESTELPAPSVNNFGVMKNSGQPSIDRDDNECKLTYKDIGATLGLGKCISMAAAFRAMSATEIHSRSAQATSLELQAT